MSIGQRPLDKLMLIALAFGLYTQAQGASDAPALPENHGHVVAQLFRGEGSTGVPLIVGFGGAEGGNAWASDYWKSQRDDFLEQGYAFLAVGYFGVEGAPRELDRIALEGVFQAITEVAADPEINQNCIAVLGASKGAELVLLLASHYPEIDAVVAIVPGLAVFAGLTQGMNTSSFSLNNEALPFVPVPESAIPALIQRDLRAAWIEMLKDEEAVVQAAIEVEKINGPIYFLSATQDEFWPSTEMSEAMIQRLKANNFAHHAEHTAIDGNHASPLTHFDKVEAFLNAHFKSCT